MFFFNFDASSGFARKNPLAIVDAFARAFPNASESESVKLVMKTTNLSRWPEANFELRRRMQRLGGIIIDAEMTSQEVTTLTSLTDVYVSLHRAEGFGLGMAEAMFHAVPVIATRYSGSEEFLNSKNSFGVGYRMSAIDGAELRFNPSSESMFRKQMVWAKPDVAQAAKWMRLVYMRPDLRRRVGDRGSQTIREKFNSQRAGEAMRSRLEEIFRSR